MVTEEEFSSQKIIWLCNFQDWYTRCCDLAFFKQTYLYHLLNNWY